jgi:hypothetical protein
LELLFLEWGRSSTEVSVLLGGEPGGAVRPAVPALAGDGVDVEVERVNHISLVSMSLYWNFLVFWLRSTLKLKS